MQRVRWSHSAARLAGAVSGFLGGLVGNQGGIRAAAMLGYDVPQQSFVATATAIALLVDAVRLPIYLVNQGDEIARIAPHVSIVTGAVVVGTYLGARILTRMSQIVFRRVVALLLLGLGAFMLAGSVSG
jgi:uncharacterized protein